MAIANAVQKDGGYIYVYDETGRQTATISCSETPPNGLKSFTSSSINVQSGSYIYIYDENGTQTGTISL